MKFAAYALVTALFAVSCGGTPAPAQPTEATMATPPQPTAQPTPRATPTARPSPTPQRTLAMLLDERGSGTKKTVTFTTTGPWLLGYAFDCGERQGNFIVYLYEPPEQLRDVLVNELATKGGDVTPVYAEGTFYLDVTSGCGWSVRVAQ